VDESLLRDLITRLGKIIIFFEPAELENRKKSLQDNLDEIYSEKQTADLKEISQIDEVLEKVNYAKDLQKTLDESLNLGEDFWPLIEGDIKKAEEFLKVEEFKLKFSGKYDKNNCILEMFSGAGGTESKDFTQILFRMYLRYCEIKGFSTNIVDIVYGEEAGIASCEIEIKGPFAFGNLKSEAGTHRLVRQSPFNANNLRQTSFCGIAVLPIIEKTDSNIEFKKEELEIQSYRSSGKGGQSVNTTNSAVRIKHIPTGITVTRQSERSFEQNKEGALNSLKSQIQLLQDEEFKTMIKALKSGGGSAEFGTQIRNYVLHPYKLVKDLRTGYESTEPDLVFDGNLDPFIQAYLDWKSRGN
jgi:peptide chain release factor 2